MNIYCFSTLSFAKLQFKSVINKAFHKHGVASFTDAWIETCQSARVFSQCHVASFTDAWIETIKVKETGTAEQSHLLQMRGLKPKKWSIGLSDIVASFTDAWIETIKSLCVLYGLISRIFYRCVDLNKINFIRIAVLIKSHLLQMRGLKRYDALNMPEYLGVASFTDAWIETREGLFKISSLRGHIFYRCVD